MGDEYNDASLITALLINRNRKVIIQPLKYSILDDTHRLIMPDDVFILGYFVNADNHLIERTTFGLDKPLSIKEYYFYGKEMIDISWLYEEDFRRKDSILDFFYVI